MAKITAQEINPTTENSSFLAKVFLAEIRNRMEKYTVMSNAFTDVTDKYDGGKTVTIDRHTDATANDYTGTINWEQAKLKQITFDVDYKKYVAIKIGDDTAALSVHRDLVNSYADDIAKKQVENLDYKLAEKLIENAKFIHGNATAGAKVTDYGDIYKLAINMKVTLDKAGVPKENRMLFVDPLVEGMLYLDPRFTNNDAVAAEVIKEGQIGRFAGFDVMVSNNFPANTDTKSVYMIATQQKMNDKVQVLDKLDIIALQDSFDTGIKQLVVAGAQAGSGIDGAVVGAAIDFTEGE